MSTDASFCAQRNLNQLFNTPFPRFNLFSVDPYLSKTYTKFDLDMRRKAEILKYSSARMSTQTNSLTKQQIYAGLVNGTIPSTNQSSCANISTPTSSSDVPGPIMYLYENPDVPLYNYATANRAYAVAVPEVTDKWRTLVNTDVAFSADSSGLTFYLQITSQIDEQSYTYATSLPIGLSIQSAITSDMVTNRNATIIISDIVLTVLYNGNLANTYYSDTPIITMSVNITGNLGQQFAFTQYLGNAFFSNMTLYTQGGYVYTMYFQATVSGYLGTLNSSTKNLVFDTATLISNLSTTLNSATNCAVNSIQPVPLGNSGFVFREA
jgi:hypothetical protein